MQYAAIHKCRHQFKISRLCKVLQVSRSGYYDWRIRTPSQRAQENARLIEIIKALFEAS